MAIADVVATELEPTLTTRANAIGAGMVEMAITTVSVVGVFGTLFVLAKAYREAV